MGEKECSFPTAEEIVEFENYRWCQNSGQKFDEEQNIYIVLKCAPTYFLLILKITL